MRFFETPVYSLTTLDGTTLTQEQSITISNLSAIKIATVIPVAASGVRVYRSATANNETLLAEIPFDNIIRQRPTISMPFVFIDDGSLNVSATAFPTTTNLTTNEQKVVPTPTFSLSEREDSGQLGAGTYYYRLAFYTTPDIGLSYTPDTTDIRFYHPDSTRAFVGSNSDLSVLPAFTEITDIFNYIDNYLDDLSFSRLQLGVNVFPAQELKINNKIRLKTVAEKITVNMSTETQSVIENTPVNILLSPSDIEIEVFENSFSGTPRYFSGITSMVFTEPGTVQYFISARANVLYQLPNVFFKVIS